jgi:two-component system chemotaxis response regulator CheB
MKETPIRLKNLTSHKNLNGKNILPSIDIVANNLKDYCCTETVIAIGASTGGIEAIRKILIDLPAKMPPIVIVQHLPKSYTSLLVSRLNQLTKLTVIEATQGQLLESSHVYISPGDKHMLVKKESDGFHINLDDSDLVCYHKPSVEVLFRSMAREVQSSGLGIILTGMGYDGAKGLKMMRNAGAYTIAQDEKTSIVFGMPKKAIAIDAVNEVLPINLISNHLTSTLNARRLPMTS